jgi:hypothetical protein
LTSPVLIEADRLHWQSDMLGLSFNSKMGAKLALGMPSGLKLALFLLPEGSFSLQFACLAK